MITGQEPDTSLKTEPILAKSIEAMPASAFSDHTGPARSPAQPPAVFHRIGWLGERAGPDFAWSENALAECPQH